MGHARSGSCKSNAHPHRKIGQDRRAKTHGATCDDARDQRALIVNLAQSNRTNNRRE
jgi:hypothetical protein